MWMERIDENNGEEWDRLLSKLRADDEAKVKNCKEEIDTLLVFVRFPSLICATFWIN